MKGSRADEKHVRIARIECLWTRYSFLSRIDLLLTGLLLRVPGLAFA